MRTAQDQFKTLLDQHVAPALRSEDFRRKDSTFRRRTAGGAWQIVNLQRSEYSDSSRVRLAVNLGVTLRELEVPAPPWRQRGWPLESECDCRTRLGHLLTGEDHWWKLGRIKPVGPTAREIVKALAERGLPWLELHADPARFLREATADPASVDFMCLQAFHRLAHAAGDAEAAAVAERELARRRRGEC